VYVGKEGSWEAERLGRWEKDEKREVRPKSSPNFIQGFL